MVRVQVGLSDLGSDIAKYASKFDMVELRPNPSALPKPATLRAWRKATHPSFTFSVVLPPIVGSLAMSKEMDAALDSALTVATTLEARVILLSTPTDVRPTTQTVERLKAVVGRLPKAGASLAWEAQGLWERREVMSVAKTLGVMPVFDAGQTLVAGGPLVYTRLRALGGQSKISQSVISRLGEQLMGRREAWVVAEHKGSALRLKSDIENAMARSGPKEAPIVVRPAPGRLRAEDEEQ
jgi:uncharacterized protein YecE (DUF72 family)